VATSESELSPNGIVTPEAVVLEFDTAGAGSRVLAELLDASLQLLALFLVVFASSVFFSAVGGEFAWVGIVVLLIASFAVIIGYPIAMETLWNGRTLGKAALGVRVVTVEGGPIRFRHAAIRGFIGLGEIWVFSGVPALVSIILSKRNQRLGDMVAGTLVLRERMASKRPTAVYFGPPPGMEAYVGSLDVGALTTAQYGAVRSFLVRVTELTPAARAALAVRLANPVAVEMHHTPPPMVSPELFLVCVAAAYQRRHAGADGGWPANGGGVAVGAWSGGGAFAPAAAWGPGAAGGWPSDGGFGEAGGAAPWSVPGPAPVPAGAPAWGAPAAAWGPPVGAPSAPASWGPPAAPSAPASWGPPAAASGPASWGPPAAASGGPPSGPAPPPPVGRR
jgi:uncharacterized RDD family membrane protein YckC